MHGARPGVLPGLKHHQRNSLEGKQSKGKRISCRCFCSAWVTVHLSSQLVISRRSATRSLAHAAEYLISRDVSNVAAVRALPMAVPYAGSSPLLLARGGNQIECLYHTYALQRCKAQEQSFKFAHVAHVQWAKPKGLLKFQCRIGRDLSSPARLASQAASSAFLCSSLCRCHFRLMRLQRLAQNQRVAGNRLLLLPLSESKWIRHVPVLRLNQRV
jgi:hypothetical protein